jgi:ABC-type glycerol-3-phosphate transport system substrate-binding protein
MPSLTRSTRRRALGAVLAGTVALAACGGGGSSSSDSSNAVGSEAPAPPDETAVAAESDTPTNQLPDVVVDNVALGNKVNLRNTAPADTAILLWMWAPH